VASIVVFTGYALTELNDVPRSGEALALIDLLVSGRYEADHATEGSLLASANQRVHFLSDVYGPGDLADQAGDVEITIAPDGTVTLTGFPPPTLRRAIRKLGD
jgi:hypothetical protein